MRTEIADNPAAVDHQATATKCGTRIIHSAGFFLEIIVATHIRDDFAGRAVPLSLVELPRRKVFKNSIDALLHM